MKVYGKGWNDRENYDLEVKAESFCVSSYAVEKTLSKLFELM